MWDVAVVGAGPAGSAAALAAVHAVPGSRVILLDRSEFPRDKPCGDGIAPHALRLLADLGVEDPTSGYRPVRDLTIGFAGGTAMQGVLHDPAYVVPRVVFDARLVAATTAHGITFRRHRVRRIEQCRDRVVLDDAVEARVIVAADGAHSDVRRQALYARSSRGHVAVAIRGYAPAADDGLAARGQVLSLAPRGWPAYAWSFPVGDGRANVGYGELIPTNGHLTRKDLLTKLELLLPGAAAGGRNWRAHHLPLSSGRPRQPDGRILYAGDAMSLINPLTGEGIYYAVLSGSLAGAIAAQVPAAGDAGRAYRLALRRELGAHLRQTTLAMRLARRRSVVERALTAAAYPAVFDDLVEIGLGRGLVTRRMITSVLAPRDATFTRRSARAR